MPKHPSRTTSEFKESPKEMRDRVDMAFEREMERIAKEEEEIQKKLKEKSDKQAKKKAKRLEREKKREAHRNKF